jgi:hypothetical protein
MLTDTLVRGARCTDRPRKLTDGRGLHRLVAPNGGRYWRYSYRYKGKQKTLALGVYPDVSLAKARTRHLASRQLLVDGIDPPAKKQTAGKTFEAVAREWHAHWMANRHQRHAHYVLKRLETDIFPEIGSLPLSEIPTSAFRNAVQKIERRGALDIAKRVLQTCGQIMRYAVANDFTAHNPVAGVSAAQIVT